MTVGGTESGAGNLISGNSQGIRGGDQSTIQGNRIGTDASGTYAVGHVIGVLYQDGESDNLIGGRRRQPGT
ncbi:MAG: hypothetical protein K2X87_02285 [Gemmataceae bacterium]|nr:hypothetical protein [Gemmataceae bacterium]